MLRPRLPSAILEPVILVESLFPHTNLHTLLCALCTWSAVMPAYLMCHVSTAICGLCQLVCVLNVAFTGFRSWYLQHFGFGRITQNFLKGASRGSGGLDVQPKKLFPSRGHS